MLQWISINRRIFLRTAARLSIFVAAVFCFINFFCVTPALAQVANPNSIANPSSTLNQGLQVIEQPLGLATTDIRVIIFRVIRIALGFIGTIMVLLIMYAGFLWMTAGGNEEQIGKAKKIIINATIGLAIILSAYSIVWFVARMLGVGSGTGGVSGPAAVGNNTQNFRGSGALGWIIKDHYPESNQTGVARNTKIIITFSRPILANTIIADKNANGIFGDCINQGAGMSWQNDCDSLILDDNHINVGQEIIQNGVAVYQSISGAAVLGGYETEGGAQKLFTLVIRPYDNLGSDTAEFRYRVRVGNLIKLDDTARDNPNIFDAYNVGDKFYNWFFTCSTELDNTPPHVVGVYPANASTVAKNSAIQIQFSEPIDPIGVQGRFVGGAASYYLNSPTEAASYIYLKAEKSALPQGNFILTNGYRTLEFTSSQKCGTNACGASIFCLPVCDKAGAVCADNARNDLYQLILKAGLPLGESWESIPFSGVMDAAGNRLDGNNNGELDIANNDQIIFANNPDNYFWNFNVSDVIDATSPYLIEVLPGLDATFISANQLWQMTFSKRLLANSAYKGVSLEEYPVSANGVPLWRVPRVSFNEVSNTSTVNMLHGAFLDGQRQYYFPTITSNITDVNFNCFYPGKGPNDVIPAGQSRKTSAQCQANDAGCCAVNPDSPLCCNGAVGADRNTTSTCAGLLRTQSR